jgi:hypothetical protein
LFAALAVAGSLLLLLLELCCCCDVVDDIKDDDDNADCVVLLVVPSGSGFLSCGDVDVLVLSDADDSPPFIDGL